MKFSISRNTRQNYSWSKKGSNTNAENITFVGSLSLIWAITSTGKYYIDSGWKHNNSKKFIWFMKNLKIWLIDRLGYRASQIVVISDNWAFHRSKRTINYLKNSNLKILFLPPYTPQMAPVELFFSLLKRMLKKHSKAQRIKIARHEGAELLKYCWNEISARDIISFFRHSAKSLRIHFS